MTACRRLAPAATSVKGDMAMAMGEVFAVAGRESGSVSRGTKLNDGCEGNSKPEPGVCE